jgi:hypothetical protein
MNCRDQTNTVVMSVAATSAQLLQTLLDRELAPDTVPLPSSFSAFQEYSVSSWTG